MKKTLLIALSAITILASCKKEKDNEYVVDSNNSTVEWKGYLQSGNFNRGTFSVAPTILQAKGGKLEGGQFTIPILSVNVLNLVGEPKAQLEAHLKSVDFFNVLVHPAATFSITHLRPYHPKGGNDEVAGANTMAEGDFSMLGVTKRISFPAKVVVNAEQVTVEALLKINRLDWGMNYASDPNLGEHYILPTVDLNVQLHAVKQ